MNVNRSILASALFAGLLPLAVQAAPGPGVRDEVRTEMAEARREVRVEMAQARAELGRENLSLGDGLTIGKASKRRHDLPKAEISPQGDLLIEGKAQAIDARQRGQLLEYRGQVIDLARLGIDAGEKAAMAAIDATDMSVFSLIVGGMTGSLQRRVEATVKQHIEPMVRQICQRLPRVYDSQQQLAASLPQFRPYATLEQDDIADCERDFRRELAAR